MKKADLFVVVAAAVATAAVLMLLRLVKPNPPLVPKASGPPQRIICMAPNIDETVFALGAGDRVVGVSSYTKYPPEAAEKPDVGGLYNPNLERIAALEPDFIVVQHRHDRIEELARQRGIRVIAVDMEGGVQPILNAIELLGRELGVAERAASLRAEIEEALDTVRRRVAGREPVPKTVVCVDRSAESFKMMYCAGRQSFFTELLEIAGGRNAFADRDKDYFTAGVEEIVRLAPDVIIETRPGQEIGEARRSEIEEEWQALSPIPAVKNRRVHVLTDPFIAVPGPRIGRVAERLAEVLHPGIADER